MKRKLRKKLKQIFWSNCWVVVFLLFVQCKLKGFVLRFTTSMVPVHIAGITNTNRLVHFKSTKKYDSLNPFLFQGFIEVFDDYAWRRFKLIKIKFR